MRPNTSLKALMVVAFAVACVTASGFGVQRVNALYQDDFSSPLSGWKVDQHWTYTEGQYRVFLGESNSVLASSLPAPTLFGLAAYCVEVDIKLFFGDGLARQGFVGFYLAGSSGSQNPFPKTAVLFGLDSYRRVLVLETFHDAADSFVDQSPLLSVSNAIQDPHRFHRLKLAAAAGHVSVFIDQQFMGRVDVFPLGGEMGLVAFTYAENNLNARFDNLKISQRCP